MRFGIYLRELSRLRAGLALSVLVAAIAALWSVAAITLLPPRLHSRSLEMASAYTQVMVDSSRSALFDLGMSTDDLQNITDRALLLGSLTTSPPVIADIAARVGVPADVLQVQAPRTPTQPRVTAVAGRSNGPLDLVRSTNQYRLDVEADPVVPFLDIYAQAPTADAAGRLANGAVAALASYLQAIEASERTPPAERIELRQLGRAQGKVINGGIDVALALLTFFIVFSAGCLLSFAFARIKRGWRLQVDSA